MTPQPPKKPNSAKKRPSLQGPKATKSTNIKTPKQLKKTKRSKQKPGQRPWWSRLIGSLIVAGIWLVLALSLVTAYYAVTLPDTDQLTDPRIQGSVRILDRNGNFVAERGQKHEGTVTPDEVPDHLINAILATEDRNFFYHPGFDPIGIARAVVTNISAGGVVQGGSTLTQQLAKDLFLSSEKSFERKFKELLLAVWLELRFTKDELLTFYINRVYLGGGTYGFPAASRYYFSKDVGDLDLGESALLAGLLKAPSRLSPFADLEASRGRMAVVLLAMLDAGHITAEQRRAIIANPPVPRKLIADGSSYFVDYVLDELSTLARAPDADIIVRTSYDPLIQSMANKALSSQLAQSGDDALQGAIVVMSTNGQVQALVGGRSYAGSSFNRATQARRQPGSSFKPFVYATALQTGLTPETQVDDSQKNFGKYRPRNYSGRYRGPMTATEALATSSNVVAVDLAQRSGIDRVIETAQSFGLPGPFKRDLSIALGSSEVRLLDLVGAYGVFANEGKKLEPHAVLEVRDREAGILYRYVQRQQLVLMTENEVRAMNSMLMEVPVRGTGRNARVTGYKIAGKTGTTSDYRDAWFVGYSSNQIAGVWVGHDDNSPTQKVTGGALPARIFAEVMETSVALNAPQELPGWRAVDVPADLAPPVIADQQPPTELKTPKSDEEDGLGRFLRRLFGG